MFDDAITSIIKKLTERQRLLRMCLLCGIVILVLCYSCVSTSETALSWKQRRHDRQAFAFGFVPSSPRRGRSSLNNRRTISAVPSNFISLLFSESRHHTIPTINRNEASPPPGTGIISRKRSWGAKHIQNIYSERSVMNSNSFALRSSQFDEEDDMKEGDTNDPESKGIENINSSETEDSDADNRVRKRDVLKGWIGSSGSSSKPMVKPLLEDGSVVEEDPPSVKLNFDNLFAGMPKMDDILSGSEDEKEEVQPTNQQPPSRQSKARPAQSDDDDAWFEEEKKQIMNNYDDILKDMIAKLNEQRKEDPDSAPENAEAIIKSVLKQEMDTEIAATRQARAQEDLVAYEEEKKAEEEARDISGPRSEAVQRLIDDDEAEIAQQEAWQVDVDDFLRYEEEAFQRATEEAAEAKILRPNSGENLDQWALDRLEDMAGRRQVVEGENMILDILEENIEDLRDRIEKEADKGSIEPETMKEWQMYRSIATRLAVDDAIAAGGKESSMNPDSAKREEEKIREKKILAQLDSWRSYIKKEDDIRTQSGLSRGPILPFEWQESWEEPGLDDSLDSTASVPEDNRSKADIRKDVNRMSIEAMESLAASADGARKEKLQIEIDYLKSALESNDYLDVDEKFFDVDSSAEEDGPVDVSDVFPSYFEEEVSSSGELTPSVETAPYDDYFAATETPRPPPSTPFFEDESEVSYDGETKPPPSTPFFEDETEISSEDEALTTDSKLGTLDEQKLTAMYRKAGARTVEEQAAIRKQWEDFQQFEQDRRDQSGLSDTDQDLELNANKELKYNISEVMGEDGNVDAEKILASIGPRPVRKKQKDFPPPAAEQNIKVDDGQLPVSENSSKENSLDEEEVLDSLYRSVSAVGGGRYKDDPEAKNEQRASFQDYMVKEDELRKSLDSLDEEIEADLPLADGSFDDVEYAEDAIASLDPRPQPKRSRIVDEGDFSDKGGILSEEDEDDETVDAKTLQDLDSLDGGNSKMPEWLRQENQNAKSSGERKSFLGQDIDEMFDDTDYEKNMRQLHEYEQRRRDGKDKQMGIDIVDILGPRSIGLTEDYKDYKLDDSNFRETRDTGWGAASFEARKNNLLDYTELEETELNALMDHKNSVFATGVSRHMPRINKPFSEFGAIFRLEGVLIDTTGLELQAWTKVAEEYGFEVPDVGDVRRASVTHPEVAVKDVFFWTDDFIQCREIALTHRRVFRDAFDAWMKDNNLTTPQTAVETSDRGFLAMGQEIVEETSNDDAPTLPSSEIEMVEVITKAWIKTAEAFGRDVPKLENIFRAASLTPDITVQQAFRWTKNPVEVDEIVSFYRSALQAMSSAQNGGDEPELVRPREDAGGSGENTLAETSLQLEIQFLAWTKVAEKYGFEPPMSAEVMAAATVNDPQIAVRDGFGWTKDMKVVNDVVRDWRKNIQELYNERTGEIYEDGEKLRSSTIEPEAETSPKENKEPGLRESLSPTNIGLSDEEILAIQVEAWNAVADAMDFESPPLDQIRLSLITDPKDAIKRLFRWTDIDEEAAIIATVYEYAVEEASTPAKDNTSAQNAVPFSTNTDQQDKDVLDMHVEAWNVTAEAMEFESPSLDQIQLAMKIDPKDAIKSVFGWTDTDEDADAVLSVYDYAMKEASKKYNQEYSLKPKEGVVTTQSKAVQGGVPSADSIFQAVFDSWVATAKNAGLPTPDAEQVQFAMSVGPEDAILYGFQWTEDQLEVSKLVDAYKKELGKRRSQWQGTGKSEQIPESESSEESIEPFRAVPGVVDWVKSLLDVEMACGVMSYLDEDQVNVFLEQAGLADLITSDKRVSTKNGYNRDSQQMLGSALRLERRPDHCVVFDANPYSSVAAHDVKMQSVAMINPYPRYELLNADTAASSFDDLTAMNIRRLFGERDYDQPLLDTQETQPNQIRKTVTKTTFWDDL